MADTSSNQYADILFSNVLMELAEVDHTIHHLGNTKAVSKVVKWVVSVVFLNAQLKYTGETR